MLNEYSDLSITAVMAWMHLALMAVPLAIFVVKLEMDDWREAHSKQAKIRRERPAPQRPAGIWTPHPV